MTKKIEGLEKLPEAQQVEVKRLIKAGWRFEEIRSYSKEFPVVYLKRRAEKLISVYPDGNRSREFV